MSIALLYAAHLTPSEEQPAKQHVGMMLLQVKTDNAQSSDAYVEMYVASTGKTPTTRRVPPRPKAPVTVHQAAIQQQPQQQRSPDLSQQRALKTELASLASQMQTRGTQLSQAEAALRQDVGCV